MSRIHEALKKAEMERSGGTVAEVMPAEPRLTEKRTASAADVVVQPTALPRPGDPLRFDDLRAHCAHPQWNPDPNMDAFGPGSRLDGAEQFRTLRSRLYQIRNSHPLRTVLITSSIAAEGKTFITANLGRTLIRQSERRALIIDGDLRRSRLHLPLGAPNTPGLSDYLRGDADEVAVIQNGQEGNLCLIGGGSTVTNPSELLSNGRIKTLLDRVGPAFDWVLFDSPPCLPVADANVLADFCDGVLLVVRGGSTPLSVVQRACQELQGRNVVGVVLNAMGEDAISSYGPYYGAAPYGSDAEQDIQ